MKRTTGPAPFLFRTPREAGEYALAVIADIKAASFGERCHIEARTDEARATMWAAIKRWTHVSDDQRVDATSAVHRFAATVYGEEPNPFSNRNPRATLLEHRKREARERAYEAHRREYRQTVGLDPTPVEEPDVVAGSP